MFEPLLIAAYVVAGITFGVTIFLTLNWERVANRLGETGVQKDEAGPISTDAREKDDHRLTDSVLVIKELISNCVIAPFQDSWLEFSFEVFNISGETLKVGYTVEGDVIFQGNRLYDKPQPLAAREIRGGSRATVSIRQPLLKDVAALIEKGSQNREGIVLSFDFRDLRIFVEELTNSPEKWPKGALPLKKRRTYRVRQNSRLKGFYLWERTDAGSETEAFKTSPKRDLPARKEE